MRVYIVDEGNGVTREYTGFLTSVSGGTLKIYAEIKDKRYDVVNYAPGMWITVKEKIPEDAYYD